MSRLATTTVWAGTCNFEGPLERFDSPPQGGHSLRAPQPSNPRRKHDHRPDGFQRGVHGESGLEVQVKLGVVA
jgi:hypothetical protein